ncbi:MAG TPA: serine/threonine-protein kinase [Blastocatellia bacterium]|nr:serine/threonine-protein kinase [Blastocatellia bacterium]
MLRKGDQIGPYTLDRKLGRGSFGFVWLAERRTVIATTQVAIKIPIDDDVDINLIRGEAALWAQASGHPNILPIIEANVYEDLVVLVSEYAPDGSLADWLKNYNGAAPSIQAAVEMAAGILAGLQHLHSRRIIHRDLKPANILLQGQEPRLTDFGISRVLKTTGLSGIVAGTPQYMAPEAFAGQRNEQTDIWAVGVILYQMLSGTLPYPQTDFSEMAVAVQNTAPRPLPSSIPEPLRQIVARALEGNPNRRFHAAAEMKSALEGFARASHHVGYTTTPLAAAAGGLQSESTVLVNPPVAVQPPQRLEQERRTPTYETVGKDRPVHLSNEQLRPAVQAAQNQTQPLIKGAANKLLALFLYAVANTIGWGAFLGLWVIFGRAIKGELGDNIIPFFGLVLSFFVATGPLIVLRRYARVWIWLWLLSTFVPFTLFALALWGTVQLHLQDSVILSIVVFSGLLMIVLQWLSLLKQVSRSWLWIIGSIVTIPIFIVLLPNADYYMTPLIRSAFGDYTFANGLEGLIMGSIIGFIVGVAQGLCLILFKTKKSAR